MPENQSASSSLPKTVIDPILFLLQNNQASCVLANPDGKIICRKNGRGIGPILEIYEQLNGKMQGTVIADKIIGKAAAFIAVCGGVRCVYADIISQGAFDILRQYQITPFYTTLVPAIINRKKTGLCPMEQTVSGICEPFEALEKIRAKYTEMTRMASSEK